MSLELFEAIIFGVCVVALIAAATIYLISKEREIDRHYRIYLENENERLNYLIDHAILDHKEKESENYE